MKKTLRSHKRAECFLSGECHLPCTYLKRGSCPPILDILFFANVVSDDMDAYLQTRTPDVSPILYTGSGLPFFNQH